MLMVICLCLQQFFGKVLYERSPQLSSSQLLFIRSVFSFLFFSLLMNKRFFHFMYSGIPRDQISKVALRVVLGIFYLTFIYTSIKYLPLVYASLIQNLSPLYIALFSCVFLKKGLSKLDTAVLLVSFLGVIIMITGKL